MGFFTTVRVSSRPGRRSVAIPFRVGWGFSQSHLRAQLRESDKVAIPFRVGWGFSQEVLKIPYLGSPTSRNPFQGGMGFFTVCNGLDGSTN